MTVHMDAEELASASEKPRASFGRPLPKPVPADFVERASRVGIYGLKKHYRTGLATLERWYRESGASQVILPRSAAPPEDLAEQCSRLCVVDLGRHYKVSHTLIRKWLKRTGFTAAPSRWSPQREAPDGFAEIAPALTMLQLRERYDVSDGLIRRWCALVGVRWRTPPQRNRSANQPTPPFTAQADPTLAGQAAQHLRRHRIVYRCDILPFHERAKMPNFGKGHWYVNGLGAVTEARMIELAEGKGFDPQAWARI